MINKSNPLTKQLTFLMALVCGISIASLYYIQPLEGMVAKEFAVSQAQIGIATTLTQIGYATGLLFLVPLGDIFERKKLILIMLFFVCLSLFCAAIAPKYSLFMVIMFVLGVSSIVPQLVIPYAGQLANPNERGEVLGTVTGGLLIGILLSRTFSGIIGSFLGWRAVYYCGLALILFLVFLVVKFFPSNVPTVTLKYSQLMKSLPRLFSSQRVVRESAFNGFCIFGAFSVFWTSLVFLMESPVYNLTSKEVGYIGLIGVIGALASVYMGKITDKKTPRFGVGIGTLIGALSYLFLGFFGKKMAGLIVGVILLDLGTQSAQVSNQARIQSLGDENRSRNNTIFMFAYFIGGATGSTLGTLAWQYYGWTGVCTVGFLFELIALFGHFVLFRKKTQ